MRPGSFSLLLAVLALLQGCAGNVADAGGAPGTVEVGQKADDGTTSDNVPVHYAVVGATAEGVPAYADPGVQSDVAFHLDTTDNDLEATGAERLVKDTRFVQVVKNDDTTGWVDDTYLTEAVDIDTFCADVRAWDVLALLRDAVAAKVGEGFDSIVSPHHGLTVRLTPEGTGLHATDLHAWTALAENVTWGPNPVTGEPVVGAFNDLGLLEFTDVVASESQDLRCNRYPQGAGAYDADIPAAFTNLNFITASVAYDGAWLSWVVGYEYVNGKPYVAYLFRLGRDDG